MSLRKLVSIKRVNDISPIPGADLIVKATVEGWNVVTKKDEFEIGDHGVYFEIDSFLPVDDHRFEFLHKNGIKTFNGKDGVRLRTVKLRKQVSQGLILPLDHFPEIVSELQKSNMSAEDAYQNNVDFSELLGVVKYEVDIPVGATEAAGLFPTHLVPKTEQERLQSFYNTISETHKDVSFYATLKMDGSSSTYLYTKKDEYKSDKLLDDEDGGQFMVASRNMLIKPLVDNTFYKAASNENIYEKLKGLYEETGITYAFQGELLGPGIQGNREGFNKYTVMFFSVFNVDEQRYLSVPEVEEITQKIGLRMVPVLDTFKPFQKFKSMDEFMKYSDNIHPMFAKVPEGIVYHSTVDGTSFKVISNKYLLKTGE